MAIRSVSRLRAVFMLSAGVLALSACADMQRAADRTQQGASDMYDSLFSSKSSPKTTTTKVDVSVPPADVYADAKTREAMAAAANDPAKPVELGSMRDTQLLPDESDNDGGVVVGKTATNVPAPVVPTNSAMGGTVKPLQPPVATTNENMGAPLMVIRFNQHHVYYDDALAKAISAAQRAKPGANYSVVSRLPDLSALTAEQQSNINSRASDNLRNVVGQMQQLGVTSDHIKIANQKQDVRSQEIAVYVN